MTQREAFEAWWGQAPVELQPLQPRTREDTLSAWVWEAWQAAQAAQPARQVPTTNYVQPVPDHCDRITWRNRYYHLPLAAELSAARAQEPVSYRYKFTHPISGEPVWRDSSPMWNGQCVQEVQQLFAAPILPVREPDWLLKTTQDLARAIARDNFPDVPQWEVFDDLPGVISEIDNMVCGMERKKPVREPLSDNTIAALRQAIAQPAKEWTDENVIAWCVERGVQAAKEPQPAQVPAELSLNIIRKWPDGFQKRLDHVWKDVDGFIPNVKLYDLQRTLAEFGFTMKVYEQAAPEVK